MNKYFLLVNCHCANSSTRFKKLWFLLSFFIFFLPKENFAQNERWMVSLSDANWKLYLDRNAKWENDQLFLPPVNLATVPVNSPSCGWDNLPLAANKTVAVPGTVEGYFWSTNDSTGKMHGDYRGVSWWSKKFSVPQQLKGKRLVLAFQSVNLRAEVFVNRKLVAYDIIGNTPFDVDITDVVQYGGSNNLDVRITDIGGTFSWDDEKALDWGKNKIPSVHGYGGITGDISIYATDKVHIDDIYIQNQSNPRKAKIFVTVGNSSASNINGTIQLSVKENFSPKTNIVSQVKQVKINSDRSTIEFEIDAPNAKLWAVKNPHLYTAQLVFKSADGKIVDHLKQDFGFRFMSVGTKNGDARLYFNGERIFLLAAMTRGFWPKMGMFPISDIAERDIQQVIDLGYNMIMYHRAIGQPASMDLCDKKGILIYEEPGGYQSLPYPPTELAQKWRREKLRRMIIRDRSRPALTNWNLDDWSYNEPNAWDFSNIDMVHALDPSRIVTFNCIQSPVDSIRKQNPFQLHMLPFDTTHYFDGWFDPYHFAAQQGYIDEYYNNPRFYARYILDPDRTTLGDSTDVVPKDQIYFLGEEGAFGTQLNLEETKKDLDKLGSDGWMDKEYRSWYESYDRFLNQSGMRKAFPTVKDLTTKMGHNLHYFHGRMIENVRMMNIADGYVLNGWSGGQTNTDIVDTYRHPTGDRTILPYYAQPLYVAVKIRRKVVPAGTVPIADIFLINEKNLQGVHQLKLSLTAPDGKIVFDKSISVNVLGGEEFGQLLTEAVTLPLANKNGYYRLNAELLNTQNQVRATGSDELFVADYRLPPSIEPKTVVLDTSGIVNSFLQRNYGISLPTYDPKEERPSSIILGMYNPNTLDIPQILNLVRNGTRLIVLENARSWIAHLPVNQIPELVNANTRQTRNLSGRQFVGIDTLFAGLPQATAMSWEYQVFYRKGGEGLPITPEGIRTVVGVGPTNSGMIGIALCNIPLDKGSVILSTLSILPNLLNDRTDCAIAKKLFVNILNIRKSN